MLPQEEDKICENTQTQIYTCKKNENRQDLERNGVLLEFPQK